ncbi:MAG TPA: dTDP-4-dehydrorhamnose reductase [Devosia sp.]|nr:dTDP-4-dehydrorhamnose reductase [Devosia sp.]
MKLLLFGRDGQVGRALQRTLPALGELVALGRDEADFAKPDSLSGLIAAARPDVIVNCAAYTAVDAAEDDRERAWTINAGAVGRLGEAARRIGAMVVHYSTDYVFDGTALGQQSESTPTSPLSVYGASKLAGEALLRESGADHLILRTSWVYAPRGRNFPLTILRLAGERDSLDVVADQIGAPTPAALIADVTAAAIGQVLADRGKLGLYHLAPTGETSWYDLARYLVAAATAHGARLRLAPQAIRPIPTSQYPAKAQRPANSRLDTGKLRAAFGINLPAWQAGILELISTLKSEGQL